jgi:hypothetical protein
LISAQIVPTALLFVAWNFDRASNVVGNVPATLLLDTSPRSVTVGATATPHWRSGVRVLAPAWSGLTTAVLVEAGDALANGDGVARVDGVEIRYYSLETPLFRPVCANDTVLVSEVRNVLQMAGFAVGTTASLKWKDVQAIRAYASAIGVPDASRVLCFQPGWLLTSSVPVGEVGQVTLEVGAPVPPPGTAVLVGQPVLESIDLIGNTGSASIDDHLTVEGSSTFESTELLVSGAPTGVGLSQLNDPVALKPLIGLIDPKVASLGVAVQLTLRASQFVVPATSVIELASEKPCVEVEVAGSPIAISVVASSITGIIIDFNDRPLPEKILVEPQGSSCG